MKKILLIAAIVSFTMASCKKDRVCSCKLVITETGPGANPQYASPTYDVTMKDTGYRTAFRACTHTKSSYVDNGVTVEEDWNCELK
jgi:hypothetical protein